MLDLNLSRARDFQNQNFNRDLVYQLKKIVGTNNFSAEFIKYFLIIERLVITLLYCSRLHAW